MPVRSTGDMPALVARDGAVCRHCGSVRNLTVDHIVPRAHGGNNRLVNKQILCTHCNQKKADKLDPADLIPERVAGRRTLSPIRRRANKVTKLRHHRDCDANFCVDHCPTRGYVHTH